MIKTFIQKVSSELQQKGYLTEINPQIPGVQALLYARSAKRARLEIAKVGDYFLFIDWDTLGFDRSAQLEAMYKCFSAYANQDFPTPHALRIQIPNLAIVAVSEAGFPEEVLSFARETALVPWYGGEVGQVILVEPGKKEITSLVSFHFGRYSRPGTYELVHASKLIRQLCAEAFEEV